MELFHILQGRESVRLQIVPKMNLLPNEREALLARKNQHIEPRSETLGERVARFRRERGITQTELAEKIGTIQPALSEYERGKVRLHGEVIVKIARALGVTTDELLGLADGPVADATKNRHLRKRLQEIDRLPKRDQQALLRTINAFLQKAS